MKRRDMNLLRRGRLLVMWLLMAAGLGMPAAALGTNTCSASVGKVNLNEYNYIDNFTEVKKLELYSKQHDPEISKKAAEAEQMLRQALVLYPDNMQLKLDLGRLLIELDKRDAAKPYLEAVVENGKTESLVAQAQELLNSGG